MSQTLMKKQSDHQKMMDQVSQMISDEYEKRSPFSEAKSVFSEYGKFSLYSHLHALLATKATNGFVQTPGLHVSALVFVPITKMVEEIRKKIRESSDTPEEEIIMNVMVMDFCHEKMKSYLLRSSTLQSG